MKTTVFYDYGNDFPYIGGTMPASKGQTYYFFSEGSLKVYFVPSKSANYTLYGEDFRIYIKVTDANGNILKGANVSILNDSQLSVYNNITYGDGRNFILKEYINLLKNLSSFIVKVTYNGKENSISYEWSKIDENKINEITVSLPLSLN